MSEDNSPLPPGLNWEEMEKGILTKMDQLEAESAKPKQSLLRRMIGLMALFLFLAVGMIYFFSESASSIANEPHNNAIPNTQEANESANQQSLKPATSNAVITPISQENITTTDPVTMTSYTEVASTNATTSRAQTAMSKASTVITANNRIITNNENTSGKTAEQPQAVQTTRPTHPQLIATDVQTLTADVQQATSKLKENFADKRMTAGTIQPLTHEWALLSSPVRDINSSVDPSSNAVNTCPTFSSKGNRQIALLGGVSYWNTGYSNTLPDRQAFENPLRSYFSQLSYQQPLKKGYSLLLGFQYQQLDHRFDWSAPVDDYVVTLVDTIIRIEINTVTGEENIIRGDVEVLVPAERIVQHFNKTQLYQAQVGVGKNWQVNNWQFGLLIGGALSVASINEGRTLYEESILDFEGSENELISNQWKLHALGAGNLTYFFSDHWGITTQLQLQKSVMNWSTENQINIQPAILNVGLGLHYKF